MAGKPELEELLTVDELAARLKVSVGSLYNRVSEGTIPFVKVGASVRFRPSEIDRWLEEQAGRQESDPDAQEHVA